MKLKKELVDELIKATKDYLGTGDTDLIDTIINAKNRLKEECEARFYVVNLIDELARLSSYENKITYEDIYKALAIVGVTAE